MMGAVVIELKGTSCKRSVTFNCKEAEFLLPKKQWKSALIEITPLHTSCYIIGRQEQTKEKDEIM